MANPVWAGLLPEWLKRNRDDRSALARTAEKSADGLTKATTYAEGIQTIAARHRLAAACYLDPLPRILEMAGMEANCRNCGKYDPRICGTPKPDHFCAEWEPKP